MVVHGLSSADRRSILKETLYQDITNYNDDKPSISKIKRDAVKEITKRRTVKSNVKQALKRIKKPLQVKNSWQSHPYPIFWYNHPFSLMIVGPTS